MKELTLLTTEASDWISNLAVNLKRYFWDLFCVLLSVFKIYDLLCLGIFLITFLSLLSLSVYLGTYNNSKPKSCTYNIYLIFLICTNRSHQLKNLIRCILLEESIKIQIQVQFNESLLYLHNMYNVHAHKL